MRLYAILNYDSEVWKALRKALMFVRYAWCHNHVPGHIG